MKFITQILGNQTVSSCLAIIIGVAVLVAGAYLYFSKTQEREHELIERNNGYGDSANPIPAGEWVQFEGYRLRFPTIQYNATVELLAMNPENPTPAATNQQIMVRVEVECQRDNCNGEEIAEQIEILAEDGTPHGEVPMLTLDENLKQNQVDKGERFSGWLVFEISEEHVAYLIEVTDFQERVSLYVIPPGS